MMKLVVVLALVALASSAPQLIQTVQTGILPASTGPLTYNAVVAGPQVIAGPQVYAAPAVQQVIAPAAVAYATAPKITQVHEPVEQHGYQIAY